MFFFIGGIQPKTVIIDRQARACSVCGHQEVYLKRVDQYLSLFFIPLFPVKKGAPFLICENCNTVFNEKGIRMDTKRAGEMRCPRCGRELASDFSFCPYCGKAI